MKITLIYKCSFLIGSIFFCSGIIAQERLSKLREKMKVEADVTVNLNSNHTIVLFETSNKNNIEIEAYIEGEGITEENRQQLLENWKVEIRYSDKEVLINSITGNFWIGDDTAAAAQLGNESSSIQTMNPMISEMLQPILDKIKNNSMPNELSHNPASMDVNGNYAHQKDEEKYIKQWADQIKEKFGNDSEKVMRVWAKQLALQTNQMNSTPSDIVFESPAGGEHFAAQMYAWASKFSGNIEITQQNDPNVTVYRYSNTVKDPKSVRRMLKIRIPVKANLKLNARHGEIKLLESISNVTASLSHTSFEAKEINGNNTLIKISYAPVSVLKWNQGRLVINYVKNCRIQNAANLQVNAESSNIFINELENKASITGSFGAINIARLSEKFNTLDLAIENSDFLLNLPDSAFNFNYSGTQSRIKIPKILEVNARRNLGNVFVNGFRHTRNTDKAITIHAKYSDIKLQ